MLQQQTFLKIKAECAMVNVDFFNCFGELDHFVTCVFHKKGQAQSYRISPNDTVIQCDQKNRQMSIKVAQK